MKQIKIASLGMLVILTLVWMLADTFIPEPFTYFTFRSVFIQYSGVLAIAAMSICLLLAVRVKWLEQPLDGLDKVYRLHKWLGISGLVLSVLHWWWVQGTKWMVGWGWLIKPAKKKRILEGLPEWQQWFIEQRGLAETIGEWAFYLAVILIVLALVKSFPYQLFLKTHKWLAVLYLLFVYHTVILTKYEYWNQPIGWLLALLLIAGTVSGLMILAGRIGHSRKVRGEICALTSYPGVKVLACTIKLNSDISLNSWPGHKPGQFAFVRSKKTEGAHPYTIASAWDEQAGTVSFAVKELGDWTGNLRQWLKVGMPVTVEGPYGCFDFQDDRKRHIWVGAGIGVTPFIAKMQHLANHRGHRDIDFFYVTANADEAVVNRLQELAANANIRLHVRDTAIGGRLTPAQMRDIVPNWQEASIWFCGPSAFGSAIKADFVGQGLAAKDFHQELFAMR